MSVSVPLSVATQESLVDQFFQLCHGNWHSQRRYYTLKDGTAEEVVSRLSVRYLAPDAPELVQLAQMHQVPIVGFFGCGAITTWNSQYTGAAGKQTTGSTVFGVQGTRLYRDRGFATPNPVTATFEMADAKTMRLRTEYNGSVFEEEIKLIGAHYRTRQTLISRRGEEQMIGQYLERRLPDSLAPLA